MKGTPTMTPTQREATARFHDTMAREYEKAGKPKDADAARHAAITVRNGTAEGGHDDAGTERSV